MAVLTKSRACFNEAEAITPRIRVAARCVVVAGPGFNEAEAITPRIPYAVRQYKKLHPKGFNEAEAITPRIPSMRKGLRGSAWSFNEAEAITPRIPRITTTCILFIHTLQ